MLCGYIPYHNIPKNTVVMGTIVEGGRPKKPENAERLGFTEELWETVEHCWLDDRNARPSAEVIHSRLKDATPFWYMKESL